MKVLFFAFFALAALLSPAVQVSVDFTDALLTNLVANGVKPYFLLGVTIENSAADASSSSF